MRDRAETPAPPGHGKESIQRARFSSALRRWRPRPIPNLDWAILFWGASKESMALTDKFGRQISDLRVSVTDRCNFRCVYCRSADPENHMAEHALLEWDEFERLVRILVGMGIRKVRVTGRAAGTPWRGRFHRTVEGHRCTRSFHDHERISARRALRP